MACEIDGWSRPRLRKLPREAILNNEVLLSDGLDGVVGILDIIINNKHVFEVSPEGFQALLADSRLGFDSTCSRLGLNSACLVDFFLGICEVIRKSVDSEGPLELVLAEHGFFFEFLRSGEIMDITLRRQTGRVHHYLQPHLVNRITREHIPFSDVVRGTRSSLANLLKDLRALNEAIESHAEFKQMESDLEFMRKLH